MLTAEAVASAGLEKLPAIGPFGFVVCHRFDSSSLHQTTA